MNQNGSHAINTASINNEGMVANLEMRHEGNTTDIWVKISPEQLNERLREGLCPYPDEKDDPQHKCAQPCYFNMTREVVDTTSKKRVLVKVKEETLHEEKQEQVEVSVHTIEGFHNNTTLTLLVGGETNSF